MLEINAHSLFSKWFSESGKKVATLFEHIEECCEDSSTLVFVLVDEVESLTSSRAMSVSSGEPGDALRVVNAVLTGLDRLRRRPNVLVLTTTNLLDVSGAVDGAFLDRADVKLYVGPPTERAVYGVLRSCLVELSRVGVLDGGRRNGG